MIYTIKVSYQPAVWDKHNWAKCIESVLHCQCTFLLILNPELLGYVEASFLPSNKHEGYHHNALWEMKDLLLEETCLSCGLLVLLFNFFLKSLNYHRYVRMPYLLPAVPFGSRHRRSTSIPIPSFPFCHTTLHVLLDYIHLSSLWSCTFHFPWQWIHCTEFFVHPYPTMPKTSQPRLSIFVSNLLPFPFCLSRLLPILTADHSVTCEHSFTGIEEKLRWFGLLWTWMAAVNDIRLIWSCDLVSSVTLRCVMSMDVCTCARIPGSVNTFSNVPSLGLHNQNEEWHLTDGAEVFRGWALGCSIVTLICFFCGRSLWVKLLCI